MVYKLVVLGIKWLVLILFLFFARRYPPLINFNHARALLKACGVYENAILDLGAIDTTTSGF